MTWVEGLDYTGENPSRRVIAEAKGKRRTPAAVALLVLFPVTQLMYSEADHLSVC
jgi:hypothetical protein